MKVSAFADGFGTGFAQTRQSAPFRIIAKRYRNSELRIADCEFERRLYIMYQIISRKALNRTVTMLEIEAPLVAKKAKAGQFIILRVDEDGERVPFTVYDTDKARGTVSIIFQVLGATTKKLDAKREGEYLCDFAGPLGIATDTAGKQRVCVVGGGVGCAIALPIARAFKENGTDVTSIIGFRTRELIILEQEFRAVSDRMHLMTDDGSFGEHGNVCLPLVQMLGAREQFDEIIAIGPMMMMKFVVEAARPYGTPVTVSMNPIMIDGTGMCGGCRVTLNRNGERITKFACVDGPDFNGYEIDFDEAISRNRMYVDFERRAYENTCNLLRAREER